MGYSVVKTIRGREYRYEVESYRDPETGKPRNKWRYVGKVEGGSPPRSRRRADETRAALIAALERLLENTPWQDVTVRAIARQAGLAEATFYRYFRSRNELLVACARHVVEDVDVRLAALAEISTTVEDERRRFRDWADEMLGNPHGSAVFFALRISGALTSMREERFERRYSAFLDYLRGLKQRDYIIIDDGAIERLATALALLVQAFSYRTVIERRTLSTNESAAVASMMERSVFG